MNTTSKFVVLSALAVLMVGATMVLAIGNADARETRIRDSFNRNIGDENVGQQNTGDANNEVDGDVGDDNTQESAGGNAVNGDFNAAGNCDDCEAGNED
jgi:hypothetical protein